jgi:glycosyltransferase involved in cell wall biosynthesis
MLTAQHQSPRVLHVITPSRMAGAETLLARLLRRTRDRQFIHRCVSSRGAVNAEMRAAGVEFDALSISGKANFLAIPRLAQAVRRHNIDVLHSHLSTASWWCGWLEQLGGPPSIGHVHGFTSALWHSRQTHLLAVSRAVKDHLVSAGIEARRITVLYNALSPDEFRPTRDPLSVRAEFGADESTPVVGTFAHLSEKKGYRELFAAMPTVLRMLPATQFWIVGHGPLADELQATTRRNGLAASVRFLGFRRDVADLMHAIDVMALPSHREPCALAYIEAALSRKPIVGCRAGGAPESIADGETGLLVPVRDPAAIAEAILTLLTNRRQAAQMGQAGYERARALFSWEKFIDTLEGVYERVLDEGGADSRSFHRHAA